MLKHKKIKVGNNFIEALSIKLLTKTFILLKGSKGYVMCGYLDLAVAEKFGDVAVKIVGVSSISQALRASVHSCTSQAIKLGISESSPIKEVLKAIA